MYISNIKINIVDKESKRIFKYNFIHVINNFYTIDLDIDEIEALENFSNTYIIKEKEYMPIELNYRVVLEIKG